MWVSIAGQETTMSVPKGLGSFGLRVALNQSIRSMERPAIDLEITSVKNDPKVPENALITIRVTKGRSDGFKS